MSDQPYRIAIALLLVAMFFAGESMSKIETSWCKTGVVTLILVVAAIVALMCAERIKP